MFKIGHMSFKFLEDEKKKRARLFTVRVIGLVLFLLQAHNI